MSQFITILQIVLGILLSASILLQNRGSGLGGAWGGTGVSYHSKRGFENLLSKFTIGLAVLFILSSIAAVKLT